MKAAAWKGLTPVRLTLKVGAMARSAWSRIDLCAELDVSGGSGPRRARRAQEGAGRGRPLFASQKRDLSWTAASDQGKRDHGGQRDPHA